MSAHDFMLTVRRASAGGHAPGPRYKWIALSNTTLGMLMATINQSIVLIALPDIFHGIGLDPLSPGNTSYLLWMFMGFLVVSAVLWCRSAGLATCSAGCGCTPWASRSSASPRSS